MPSVAPGVSLGAHRAGGILSVALASRKPQLLERAWRRGGLCGVRAAAGSGNDEMQAVGGTGLKELISKDGKDQSDAEWTPKGGWVPSETSKVSESSDAQPKTRPGPVRSAETSSQVR
jgi:hypothetical protein